MPVGDEVPVLYLVVKPDLLPVDGQKPDKDGLLVVAARLAPELSGWFRKGGGGRVQTQGVGRKRL